MYFSVQDKKGRKDENSPPLCMVMMIETALIITHVNYQLPIEQKKKQEKNLYHGRILRNSKRESLLIIPSKIFC